MHITRPFSVWLGILVALMQLLLPQVHATAYAARGDDPFAYALCGAGVTPSLAAELRDILPAEVVDALDADHATPELPDCHACVGAHAGAAAQTGPALGITAAAAAFAAPVAADAPATPQRTRPPPARAPPLSV